MAKHNNRNMVMKIFSEAAEILEIPECQEVVNGINKIIKGGEYGPKNLDKGYAVTVYWPQDESKATGTIKKVAPFMAFIAFDDGEQHWVPNAWITKATEPEAPKKEEK